MNVIPFPAARRVVSERDVELLQIVGALNALGEPATSAEMVGVLQRIGVLDLAADQIEASLRAFSHAAPTWWPNGPVFRAVELGGRSAWAFTSAFRIMMRTHGLAPSLRV